MKGTLSSSGRWDSSASGVRIARNDGFTIALQSPPGTTSEEVRATTSMCRLIVHEAEGFSANSPRVREDHRTRTRVRVLR
jgi:hypothetical protein